MRRAIWTGVAGLLLAGTAGLSAQSAQDAKPASILPPGFGQDGGKPAPAQPSATNGSVTMTTRPTSSAPQADVLAPDTSSEGMVQAVDTLEPSDLPPPPPVAALDVPQGSRRSLDEAGVLDPKVAGLGGTVWGGASGPLLSHLLRGMNHLDGSRWAHIALRNVLMVKGPAPRDVNGADWAAERAWLLLKMGEATAARALVSSLDVDRFTPKMTQVAFQTALANGDAPMLCPLKALDKLEPKRAKLVAAICAAVNGESERAAANIDAARRRGGLAGIDLSLADKVVGAGSDSGRSVTIEWEPVETLTSWRYGLAAATGLMPPARLLDRSRPQVAGWLATNPMYSPADRLASARSAAAQGVFSSQAMIDLYSQLYDATPPDDLATSDAWQLRLAYVGADEAARVEAMRKLWGVGKGPNARYAGLVTTARAATLVAPSDAYEADVPDLIAAMLAGGFDRSALRWAGVVDGLDDGPGDRAWAMLATAAPEGSGIDVSEARVRTFARHDDEGKRSALLVAALAGLGRLPTADVEDLNRSYELGLGRQNVFTRLLGEAAKRRQQGTVVLLAAMATQAKSPAGIEPLYLLHAVRALKAVGLDFQARMIASEALARS